MKPTALIADDEPLLARSLARMLSVQWPELELLPSASNGPAALAALREPGADIAFLDIRMPGASGLEVARILAEDWDDDDRDPPLVVFATAYDEHALEAFEAAAVDYLVKPVTETRLERCIERLKARLQTRTTENRRGDAIDALARQVHAMLVHEGAGGAPGGETGAREPRAAPLRAIQASVGNRVQMIPIGSVRMFEAADKYVVVHHAGGEALIREPLRELLPKLDPARFAQIHRGSIVNLDHVQAAEREENGRLRLIVDGLQSRPIVSRLYGHLFKPM
ncbi:MAG: LytTR family DNA-binding domain-containing protein [Burkholderiaceae bacterium]